MNLRGVANRATRSVNPNTSAVARICTGYTTSPAGRQEPSYAPPCPISLQVQALTKSEVTHLDGLNLSRATTGAYANLQLTGVDRVKQSGGDLVAFDGDTWLVLAVLEGWTKAGWCKVALARQAA